MPATDDVPIDDLRLERLGERLERLEAKVQELGDEVGRLRKGFRMAGAVAFEAGLVVVDEGGREERAGGG